MVDLIILIFDNYNKTHSSTSTTVYPLFTNYSLALT